ncbi:Alanine racemase [Lutibaculum baratangense AMV1]|uniref:Alanine racemase n=2 Tax=Lutibaculum TaxID=1358438 RepID=V4QXP8_9HYPH|nr:Alanine racemase [Lutibaculum baratangense AMV1]
MRANIARLQQVCDRAGIANRPHIKTHKSPEIARMQIAAGAVGIACQKLGEAEVMADAGFDDILICYNILGAPKLRRLRALAERIRLTVACDSAVTAEGLSRAMAGAARPLDVLVECDTGRRRAGVETAQEAVALATRISSLPGLEFAGLMIYPPVGGAEETSRFVAAVREGCAGHRLEVRTVSAGGTPNLKEIGLLEATEYRSGTSIFNDRDMVACGAAALDDCALHVYATVVSKPSPDRCVIDAGSKTLTSDRPSLGGHGHLVDYPEAKIFQLSEEHGVVDLSGCERRPEIGEIVRIVPNHVCVVVNMFDELVAVEADGTARRLPVAARGRVA